MSDSQAPAQEVMAASSSASALPEVKASPTVFRIKRRITEDPAQALLMSFKRLKGENGKSRQSDPVGLVDPTLEKPVQNEDKEDADAGVVSQVLHFAGTITETESEDALNDSISQALATVRKPKPLPIKSHDFKRRVLNPQEKSRANFQSSITENRFRLVTRKRDVLDVDKDRSPDKSSSSAVVQEFYNLYDAVEEPGHQISSEGRENRDPRESGAITCNGMPLIKDRVANNSMSSAIPGNPEVDFVYDLYVGQGDFGFGDTFDDKFISLYDLPDDNFGELRFDGLSDDDSDCHPERDEFEEDSNDEMNWRNDYPDSDPDNVKADNSYFGTGQVDELGTHIENINFEDSSDDDDYESSYRAYKKKVLSDLNLSSEVVSVSEDSD